MEYSWDIQTLKRDLSGNVVINIRWDCTATYNSASVHQDGGVDIPYLDPTASGFIPYDDWKESLTDYALWYSTYANKCKNEKQLYKLLNKQYAEANYYPQALQRIIKRDQLESKFKK